MFSEPFQDKKFVLILSSIPALLFLFILLLSTSASAAHAEFVPLTITGTTTDVIYDNDFENGVGELDLSSSRISTELTTEGALNGDYSFNITSGDHGGLSASHTYPWADEIYGEAVQLYAKAHIPEGNNPRGLMRFCAVAYQANDLRTESCHDIPGTQTGDVTVNTVLDLDPTIRVRRVFGYVQVKGYGPYNLTVDDMYLAMYRTDNYVEPVPVPDGFEYLSIEDTTPEVIYENDFEHEVGDLDLFSSRVSTSRTKEGAINGDYSFKIVSRDFGGINAKRVYPTSAEVYGEALQLYANARIPEGNHPEGLMQFCAVAYQADDERTESCHDIPGTQTGDVEVHTVLDLDPTIRVNRVFGYIQVKGYGPYYLTVDDMHLVMYRKDVEPVPTEDDTEPTQEPNPESGSGEFAYLDIAGTEIEELFHADFESGIDPLMQFSARTTQELVSASPVGGNQFLKLNSNEFGGVIINHDYQYGAEVYAQAMQVYGQVNIPNSHNPRGLISFCAIAFLVDGERVQNCQDVSGEQQGNVTVDIALDLDPSVVVTRAFYNINFKGYGPYEINVDDLRLVMYRTTVGDVEEPELPEPSGFSFLDIAGTQAEELFHADFESVIDPRMQFSSRTTPELLVADAFGGNQRLQLDSNEFGAVTINHDYKYGQAIFAEAMQIYGEVNVPETHNPDALMQFCALAYLAGGERVENCHDITGAETGDITVNVVLDLDPTVVVTRAFYNIRFKGYGPYNLSVDDMYLVMYRTNLDEDTQAEPGSEPEPNPVPAPVPNDTPEETTSVRLIWDAPSQRENDADFADDEIAFYTLHWGEESGNYLNSAIVSSGTDFEVDELVRGKTYYFVVKVVDQQGVESGPSRELQLLVP